MTYWSGIVNEADLCHIGGTPHGLTDVLGLRSEEIDGLCKGETNHFLPLEKNAFFMKDRYECSHLCDLVHLDGAKPLMTYAENFLPERLGGHQVYHLQDRDICPRVDNTTGRVLAVNRIKICLYLRFYRIIFLDKTRI